MIDRPMFDDGADDEELLDEEFPLGDGTADTATFVTCPYCAQESEIAVDPGSGNAQDYVEDCPVCCRPWYVHVRYRRDGGVEVSAERIQDD